MNRGDEDILLRLVVDRDADPITGTLTRPGEPPLVFTGWLGLTNAIEVFRGARDEIDAPLLVHDDEHLSDKGGT